jgi:hypothetical protein
MTSVMSGIKQTGTDMGYFMPVSSLQGIVYSINYGSGSGGSFQQGGFNVAGTATVQQAFWGLLGAQTVGSATGPYLTNGNPYLSSINQAGAGILKDLGKTVVSAGRTFRKVQLVVNNSQRNGANFALSTNGVAGVGTYQAGTTTSAVQDFLTGYIELGFEGTGPSAPVVPYGR